MAGILGFTSVRRTGDPAKRVAHFCARTVASIDSPIAQSFFKELFVAGEVSALQLHLIGYDA